MERLAFNMMRHDEFFYLFNKKHKDLVDLFYKNNVGGPAIVFDRWQEKGKNTFSIYKHNIILYFNVL